MDESLEEYWQKREEQLEIDKKNYNGPYCCLLMHYSIDEFKKLSSVIYDRKLREYYLQSISGPGGEKMYFCIHCGTKLPTGLSNTWFDTLEQEYNLKAWNPDDRKKIPSEFLTDEWWKKRNL